MTGYIRPAHGFGGSLSQQLLDELVYPALSGSSVTEHRVTEDAAFFGLSENRGAFSTDSYTVKPIFFPGGNIGKLAVAGTVNDLAVSGADVGALSLSLIIEEGFALEDLEQILQSAGDTCRNAGVTVITGDTKVVERGSADGIFINTAGVGSVRFPQLGPGSIRPGDSIIVSGTIGDHGAAILSARERIGSGMTLVSDCAPLNGMIRTILETCGSAVHAMRDPTRGGLAAVLNEFAADTSLELLLREEAVPIRPEVHDFLDILGMDPLLLANEGKIVLFCLPEEESGVLSAMRSFPEGKDAAVIGTVARKRDRGRVLLETGLGTTRILNMPVEPGMPRIC